jgi:hypothetical protein
VVPRFQSVYRDEVVGGVAAIALVVFALWIGTVLPVREWRTGRNAGN